MVSETTEPSRFFDAATGGKMALQLQPDGAKFKICQPFGYRDPKYDEVFIIPKDVEHFRTGGQLAQPQGQPRGIGQVRPRRARTSGRRSGGTVGGG